MDFLNRTTAGNSTAPQQHHSKTPLIQNQVAQESSSSEEASSEEDSSEDEDSSEASSEHEDAAPNGIRQVQAVGGRSTGTQQPVSKTQSAKSAAGKEPSSEEETDDSSDDESESEDISSEEDQGAAAKGKMGAAEVAAIAAQAANTCGMAGSVLPGRGAGQAREAEGAGGGLQVPGSKAKQGSVTKTQQNQGVIPDVLLFLPWCLATSQCCSCHVWRVRSCAFEFSWTWHNQMHALPCNVCTSTRSREV